MRLDLHGDVQIARLAAVRPGVALARHADPRAVVQPGRHAAPSAISARISSWRPPHAGQRVSRLRAGAAARPHGFENTMWPRADFTTPVPWQCRHRRSGVCSMPAAAARPAVLVPRDGDLPRAAAHRLVEATAQRLMQIGAALGAARRVRLRAAATRPRTDRRRSAPTSPLTLHREIEALEPERRRRRRRPTGRRRVVAAPPIRIAQRLVRLGDLAELLRRQPVARVDVGVILAAQDACTRA